MAEQERYPVVRFRPSFVVEFAGGRGGSAPLTWGQRFMYDLIRSLPGQQRLLTPVLHVPVPAGRDVRSVLSALRQLVERHETLRTVVRAGDRGHPVQQVVRSGAIPVGAYEVAEDPARPPHPAHPACPAPPAQQLSDRLRAEYADALYGDGWRFMACLQITGGAPRSVALLLSHLLADEFGMALIRADCARLLQGDPPSPVDLIHPLDVVRFEHSPEGRRRNHAALQRARSQLALAPHAMFPAPRGQPESVRYQRCEFVSPAAATAARAVAKRLGVPVSAVLLGLLGILASRGSGLRRLLLMIVSHNRLELGLDRYPSYLVQLAPVALTGIAGSVEQIIRRAAREMFLSCDHGRYCPVEFAQLVKEVGYRRGAHLDLGTMFNYHSVRSWTPPHDELADPAVLAGLRSRTSFDWRANRVVRPDCRLYADASVSDALVLRLRLDTVFVSPAWARAMAYALESALIGMVAGDLDVEQVAELAGLSAGPATPSTDPASSGSAAASSSSAAASSSSAAASSGGVAALSAGLAMPELVEVDAGLVSLARCRAAAHEALALVAGEFFVEHTTGEPRLVAHLVPADRRMTVESVHHRLVDTLARHPVAMAAHRYVLHTTPPADTSDVDAWRQLAVLRSGPGRPTGLVDLPPTCPVCAGTAGHP